MARDYAPKKQPRKPAKRRNNQTRKTAPRMAFHAPSFSAGIVLGALLLGFAMYTPELLESHLPTMPEQQAEADDFKFEFHSLLANSRVTSERVFYPDATAEPEVAQHWFLQAGSFRRSADAERLTAELLLVDMPAIMSTVTLDDGPWYRVTVGPFTSKKDSQRSMTRLRQLDISALLFAKPITPDTAG